MEGENGTFVVSQVSVEQLGDEIQKFQILGSNIKEILAHMRILVGRYPTEGRKLAFSQRHRGVQHRIDRLRRSGFTRAVAWYSRELAGILRAANEAGYPTNNSTHQI